MSEEEDPKIVLSPLSCTFLEGDLQVDVHIFRLEDSKEWALEVIDEDNTSIVWNQEFETDEAAWQAFEDDGRELGLAKLIAVEETTVH